MRRNRYGIRGDWGRRRSEAEEIRSGGDCIPLWDSDGFTATIADALNPSPGSPLRKLEEQIQLPLDKYGVRDDVGTTALSFTSSTKMVFISGEVTLWEVGSREKVVTEPFKIWNMEACCVNFQGSIVKDPSISVSRVSWSPDGNLIGVAFTKHLIHIYAYHGSELRQHLEPCLFPFL